MPIVIDKRGITRTCNIVDCGVEVLGVCRCICGYNEHIYCAEHACTRCAQRQP